MTARSSALGGDKAVGLMRRAAGAVIGLTAVMAVAWVVDVKWCIPDKGRDAQLAAGVAALTCWFTSVMALVVTVGVAKEGQFMAGALGGIVFRTGGPLAAMAAGTQVPWLVRHGFAGQVVVFFLVSLFAETFLVVWIARRSWKVRFWR